MAAVLSEEQFLEMILNDDEDHETDESCEPYNAQIIRGKPIDLVASFDAGPEFKRGFFATLPYNYFCLLHSCHKRCFTIQQICRLFAYFLPAIARFN
jgi:hypothetical protein